MKKSNSSVETQEVEVRAIISKNQWASIVDKLKTEFAYEGKEFLTDNYFCKKTVFSFEELEMVEIGSFSLRLRKSKTDDIENVSLNTKTITQHNDHNSWQENETMVSSYQETKAILETLGFKSFFELEKERLTYSKDDVTVVLEDVKDFGPIIEVEILTTKNASNNAKVKIRELLCSLEVTDEQVVPKSVTNILMKKLVKF